MEREDLILRELDTIQSTLLRQSEKIDALALSVNSLKVKAGVISSVFGFIAGLVTLFFGK